MASTVPEVHWAEGMFLRPQHFQLFSRHTEAMLSDAWRRGQPYHWGLSDLELAEEHLENFTLSIRRFEGHLKTGAFLQYPTNVHVDARDFSEHLGETAEDTLIAYLAVPALKDGEANTLQRDETDGQNRRFQVDTAEFSDENRGGEPQRIDVRKLNARILLEGENMEGYDVLPIAMLRRSGHSVNRPILDNDFIPPVTNMASWQPLAELADGLVQRVKAKFQYLRAEFADGRLRLDMNTPESWQSLFKLGVVGSFQHTLHQLAATPGMHPFSFYLELTRLAGELSMFEDRAAEPLPVPTYDHDNLGRCFRQLVFTVETLLERVLSGGFTRAVFRTEGTLLMATIGAEWSDPSASIFICVESDLSEEIVESRVLSTKIGASAEMSRLKEQRLLGFDKRMLRRAPTGLPAQPRMHYFSVTSDDEWRRAVSDGQVAVDGGIDPDLEFSMFLVKQPDAASAGSSS